MEQEVVILKEFMEYLAQAYVENMEEDKKAVFSYLIEHPNAYQAFLQHAHVQQQEWILSWKDGICGKFHVISYHIEKGLVELYDEVNQLSYEVVVKDRNMEVEKAAHHILSSLYVHFVPYQDCYLLNPICLCEESDDFDLEHVEALYEEARKQKEENGIKDRLGHFRKRKLSTRIYRIKVPEIFEDFIAPAQMMRFERKERAKYLEIAALAWNVVAFPTMKVDQKLDEEERKLFDFLVKRRTALFREVNVYISNVYYDQQKGLKVSYTTI